MNREEYLKNLMELKSGSVRSFASEIEIPYTTIRSILERGILNAKMDNIIKICAGLNISPEALADFDSTVINDIHKTIIQLDDFRQVSVLDYSQEQLSEQKKSKIVQLVEDTYVAANPTAIEYGDATINTVTSTEMEIPDKADFAIQVKGDSMEPLIMNNSIIFYKKQETIENGEIAIVEIDGESITCKQIYLHEETKSVVLHSLNSVYEDRVIPGDRIRIIGKVII